MSAAKIDPITVRPADACRMMGIGKTKLYELIKAGDIRSYKLGAATVIDVAEIRAYLDRQRGRAA